MPRKSLSVCLLLTSACFLSRVSNAQQTPLCNGHARLNIFERIQFLQMSESTRPEVSAQYLSEPSCGRQMLDALSRQGAKIDYSDEKSGYALVRIARSKLLDTLDTAGIEYAFTRDDDRIYHQDLDATIPQRESKAEPIPLIAIPNPKIATALPKDGPYF